MSRRRAPDPMLAPLTSDHLWRIEEAARYFGMGEGWVREHVPAVLLPGQGDRRAVRYLPETCREFARRLQSSNADLTTTSESAA